MQFCDKFLFDCSFNGFEWFLIFLNKILLLRFAYILYIYNAKVGGRKWISKWENWPPQVWLNPHFQSFAHLSDHRLILLSNATNDFMISKFFFFLYLLLLEWTFGLALSPLVHFCFLSKIYPNYCFPLVCGSNFMLLGSPVKMQKRMGEKANWENFKCI